MAVITKSPSRESPRTDRRSCHTILDASPFRLTPHVSLSNHTPTHLFNPQSQRSPSLTSNSLIIGSIALASETGREDRSFAMGWPELPLFFLLSSRISGRNTLKTAPSTVWRLAVVAVATPTQLRGFEARGCARGKLGAKCQKSRRSK